MQVQTGSKKHLGNLTPDERPSTEFQSTTVVNMTARHNVAICLSVFFEVKAPKNEVHCRMQTTDLIVRKRDCGLQQEVTPRCTSECYFSHKPAHG